MGTAWARLLPLETQELSRHSCPSAWRSVNRREVHKLSFDFLTGKGFPTSGLWKMKAGVWLSWQSTAQRAGSPGFHPQRGGDQAMVVPTGEPSTAWSRGRRLSSRSSLAT